MCDCRLFLQLAPRLTTPSIGERNDRCNLIKSEGKHRCEIGLIHLTPFQETVAGSNQSLKCHGQTPGKSRKAYRREPPNSNRVGHERLCLSAILRSAQHRRDTARHQMLPKDESKRFRNYSGTPHPPHPGPLPRGEREHRIPVCDAMRCARWRMRAE